MVQKHRRQRVIEAAGREGQIEHVRLNDSKPPVGVSLFPGRPRRLRMPIDANDVYVQAIASRPFQNRPGDVRRSGREVDD